MINDVIARREEYNARLRSLEGTLPSLPPLNNQIDMPLSRLSQKELQALNRERMKAYRAGMTLEQYRTLQDDIQIGLQRIADEGYNKAARSNTTATGLGVGFRQLAGGTMGGINMIGDLFGGNSTTRITFADRMQAFSRGVNEWNEENLTYG